MFTFWHHKNLSSTERKLFRCLPKVRRQDRAKPGKTSENEHVEHHNSREDKTRKRTANREKNCRTVRTPWAPRCHFRHVIGAHKRDPRRRKTHPEKRCANKGPKADPTKKYCTVFSCKTFSQTWEGNFWVPLLGAKSRRNEAFAQFSALQPARPAKEKAKKGPKSDRKHDLVCRFWRWERSPKWSRANLLDNFSDVGEPIFLKRFFLGNWLRAPSQLFAGSLSAVLPIVFGPLISPTGYLYSSLVGLGTFPAGLVRLGTILPTSWRFGPKHVFVQSSLGIPQENL